jgi:hypothetical protein
MMLSGRESDNAVATVAGVSITTLTPPMKAVGSLPVVVQGLCQGLVFSDVVSQDSFSPSDFLD